MKPFCSLRHRRDRELSPPGDGELRPDQALDHHDHPVLRLLRVPEDSAGRSPDQHLLRHGRGAALHLWEAFQVTKAIGGSNESTAERFWET